MLALGRFDPRTARWIVILCALLIVIAVGAGLSLRPLLIVSTALLGGSIAFSSRTPDLVTLVLLGLLYANAAVVAVRSHGVPFAFSVLVPCLLLAPLAHHVLKHRRPLRLGAAGPWLLALLVLHVLSAIVSDEPAIGLQTAGAFATDGVGLYLLIINVLRSRRAVRNAALTFVAVAGAAGALSTVQMLTGTFDRLYFGFSEVAYGDLLEAVNWRSYDSLGGAPASEIRAVGFIGEANFYAFVLTVTLPFAVAFVRRPERPIERLIAVGALPMITTGIIFTYSRGAAVVIGATVVVLAVVGLIPRRTLVVMALGGLSLVAIVPSYGDRLVGLAAAPGVVVPGAGGEQEADAALVGRYSEMLAAAYAFADHPVLGVGPGQFPANYQRYAQPLGFSVHEGDREAHNLYLHLAAELGLFGLLSLLGLLVTLARQLLGLLRWAPDRPGRAFTIACISTLTIIAINGMFLHLAYVRYLAMPLALLAAWCAASREEDADIVEARSTATPAGRAPATRAR